MTAVEMIMAKRDGRRHSAAQIRRWVRGVSDGEIPDYQVAAWLMAVLWRGMDARETLALTLAMAASGEQMDLSSLGQGVVDKHSTGGVGDKTSLVVGPLAVAMGLTVAKMSGHALGHTGGTLDKLQSIAGLQVELSPEAFLAQAREVGLVIAGQSARLAPADKTLYALLDLTGTVDSLALIAASIMSKKLAAGAPAVVLDVKVGRGAFLKSMPEARELAERMMGIGQAAGRRMAACLSAMDQPLGRAIGNALELREAIGCLRGEGPADLADLSCSLVNLMLLTAGRTRSLTERADEVARALDDGRGLGVLRRMISAQGGDARVVDEPERLPRAPLIHRVDAPLSGWLADISPRAVAQVALELGAGRSRPGAAVDPAVGIVLLKGRGDALRLGEPLAEIHARRADQIAPARAGLLDALRIVSEAPEPLQSPVLDILMPRLPRRQPTPRRRPASPPIATEAPRAS